MLLSAAHVSRLTASSLFTKCDSRRRARFQSIRKTSRDPTWDRKASSASGLSARYSPRCVRRRRARSGGPSGARTAASDRERTAGADRGDRCRSP
jgi:hypothetical protein